MFQNFYEFYSIYINKSKISIKKEEKRLRTNFSVDETLKNQELGISVSDYDFDVNQSLESELQISNLLVKTD